MAHFPFSSFLVTALVLSLLASDIHARDSQFFSKVTRLEDSKTKTTQLEPVKAPAVAESSKETKLESSDDEPIFIPQTGHNGYGLYSHDDESTTTSSEYYNKAEKESDEVKFHRNYDSGDNSNMNTMLYGNNDVNMERHQQQTIDPATNNNYYYYPVDRNTNNYRSNYNSNFGLRDTSSNSYFYNSDDKPQATANNYIYNHNAGTADTERFNRYRQQYNNNPQNGMQSGGTQFNDEFTFNP